MFKDMFGNEIKVGDYLAYAELNGKTAVQNIRKVVQIDKHLHTIVVFTHGYMDHLGSTKKIQCASEKAIVLKDYKEADTTPIAQKVIDYFTKEKTC